MFDKYENILLLSFLNSLCISQLFNIHYILTTYRRYQVLDTIALIVDTLP